MSAISLLPRDRVFFDLFEEAGQNSLRSARLLKEMLEVWPDAVDSRTGQRWSLLGVPGPRPVPAGIPAIRRIP